MYPLTTIQLCCVPDSRLSNSGTTWISYFGTIPNFWRTQELQKYWTELNCSTGWKCSSTVRGQATCQPPSVTSLCHPGPSGSLFFTQHLEIKEKKKPVGASLWIEAKKADSHLMRRVACCSWKIAAHKVLQNISMCATMWSPGSFQRALLQIILVEDAFVDSL